MYVWCSLFIAEMLFIFPGKCHGQRKGISQKLLIMVVLLNLVCTVQLHTKKPNTQAFYNPNGPRPERPPLLKCHLFSPAMGWEGVGGQENIKTLLQYSLLLTWSLRGKPFISFTPLEPPLGYYHQQQGSLTYYYTLLCKIERFNFLESQLLASGSRVYNAPFKSWLYHSALC